MNIQDFQLTIQKKPLMLSQETLAMAKVLNLLFPSVLLESVYNYKLVYNIILYISIFI